MLLKYINYTTLTEDDGYEFFTENREEIMSYYSQYMAMYDDLESIEGACLTITYLIHGQDENVPDSSYNLEESEILEMEENLYLGKISALIMLEQSFYDLVKLGLMEIKTVNGERMMNLTNKGQLYAQKLSKD